ncbi:MAG: hypothetical protein DRJ51_02595 [Thermoprotei archaeon]|nr:MAG: hypothetical protein DRJ51_02595 [Thermoprotei archaeon]RLF03017.1 MAG: hypothetical protein DRJ59_01965 [Thermoprotei archaeon]
MEEKIEIHETKRVEEALMVLGFPDTGLVGAIAATYLAEKTGMIEIGFIDSPYFPPVLPFHKHEPRFPVRIMAKDNIVTIFSEIAIPVPLMTSFAKKLVDYLIERNSSGVIMLGGIAVPNRIDLQKPTVYGLGITAKDRDFLKSNDIKLLDEGFLAGVYAQIVKECIKKKVGGVVLLAESYVNYPDPGAAAAVLEAFSKLYGYDIDTQPLLDQAEELKIKLRELMKRTMETLRHAQKGYEQTLPLLYR